MKIGILGAGALGSTFGAMLAQAGHETWLVNRPGEHIEAVKRRGLRVVEADLEREVHLHASCAAAEVGTVDVLVVLVKSFSTRAAIASALPMVAASTVVLSLQNGLGHEDILAEVVGRERVVAGKTYVGGVMLAPGHIRSGVQGKQTFIGELDGSLSERVQRIAEVFTAAGLATTVSRNIVGTMWDKLLINVATGALTGITSLTYGQLYREPLLRETALAAVAEAIAVAGAAGVRLSLQSPQAAWNLASEGLPASFKTSLLQSLEKGSVTEIDFINGAVVRLGQRHGVATPINSTLVACIKGIERAMADRQQEEASR